MIGLLKDNREAFKIYLLVFIVMVVVGICSVVINDLYNELRVKEGIISELRKELVDMENRYITKLSKLKEEVLGFRDKLDGYKGFNIGKYLNEREEELMMLVTSREVNKEMYYIRNELLYRNGNVKRLDAAYMSLWIYTYSNKFGVDPYLSLAVIIQESDCRHTDKNGNIIMSKANAVGIMQITPVVERIYGGDRYKLEDNLRQGIEFIADLSYSYKNDLIRVLAHYNGGSNPDRKIKEYKETRNYVKEVPVIYKKLLVKYGKVRGRKDYPYMIRDVK